MNATLRGFLLISGLMLTFLFTGYQTFEGYQIALGFLPAFVVALLCGGLLFWLSITLHKRLKDGGSTSGLWFGCLIVTLVSMPGNFNAFYTGFVRTELIKEELEEKRNALDEIYNKSQIVLEDRAFSKLESEVNSLKKQLRSQIMNEGNPGLGEEAKSIIVRLNSVLGDSLTPLVAQGQDPDSLEKLADRYDQNIDAKLEARRVSMVDNAEGRKKTQEDNLREYTNAMKLTDNALDIFASDKGRMAQVKVINAIQQSAKAYSRIGANTRSSISDDTVFEYNKRVTLRSDKVGTIDFSLNSALSHLGHFATWLSLFLAFFIDMGVPLTMRLIVKSDRDSGHDSDDDENPRNRSISRKSVSQHSPMVLE